MSDSNIPTGREYMQGRREYVQRIQDKIERAERKGKQDKVDSLREELDTFALAVDVVKHIEIMLGFGGPTDWLDVEIFPAIREVKSVTYHYAWAGETFRTTLSESDDLYRYAEGVAEYYVEGE